MNELKYPNNIAIIRKIRGFSQAYVANQIGVSRPKYIDIEKGLKELTISQVKKLQELFDVEFDDLIGVNTDNIDIHKFINKNTSTNDSLKSNHNSIKLFENKSIRSVWDKDKEKWWFSIVDIIGILSEQPTADRARNYWKVLKHRLTKEGAQLVTNCNQLKMQSPDGKYYKTDAADTEQILRIIQSIPSKKAEPFKQWLAQVGSERINQMADPEKSIEQALRDYKRLGYSDNWINQRLKNIEIRKDLTDTWSEHGIKGQQYASLTDIIYQTWAGKKVVSNQSAKEIRTQKLLK